MKNKHPHGGPPGQEKKKEKPEVVEEIPKLLQKHVYAFIPREENVYDGDTLRGCQVPIFPGITIELDLRLAGIQAPEIRTRDAEEKKKGYESKDFLSSSIVGSEITMRILGKGKYGRWIVELHNGHTNVNQMMLDAGYAEVYK